MKDKNKPAYRKLADSVIKYLEEPHTEGLVVFTKNERERIRRAFKKAYELGRIPDVIPTEFRRQPQPFIWVTHNGRSCLPSQMATPHLFHAIRMIFNHSVPAYYRIPGVKHYADVPHWNREYKIQALNELQKELESRKDYESELSTQQIKEYLYMQYVAEIHSGKGGRIGRFQFVKL